MVRAQLELIRLRGSHPAFAGTFTSTQEDPGVLTLTWTHGAHHAELRADFVNRAYRLTVSDHPGA